MAAAQAKGDSVTEKKPVEIKAKKTAPAEAECYLYGDIGGWEGITADHFRQAIEALGEFKELRLYVNSPGGSVFDGKAIVAQLERVKARAKVIAIVDGIAASAASFVAIAAHQVLMYPASRMMIHMPHAIAAGSAEDFRKMADLLDSEAESLVEMYRKKSGLPAAELRDMLAAETWFTAEEAVAKGLADGIAGEPSPKASAESSFQTLVATTKALTDPRQVALWRTQRTVEAMRARTR